MTKDFSGKIEKVTLTEIQIKTKKGDLIHVPNSVLIKSEYTIKRPKSNQI